MWSVAPTQRTRMRAGDGTLQQTRARAHKKLGAAVIVCGVGWRLGAMHPLWGPPVDKWAGGPVAGLGDGASDGTGYVGYAGARRYSKPREW
jgi:hypothetical protein